MLFFLWSTWSYFVFSVSMSRLSSPCGRLKQMRVRKLRMCTDRPSYFPTVSLVFPFPHGFQCLERCFFGSGHTSGNFCPSEEAPLSAPSCPSSSLRMRPLSGATFLHPRGSTPRYNPLLCLVLSSGPPFRFYVWTPRQPLHELRPSFASTVTVASSGP